MIDTVEQLAQGILDAQGYVVLGLMERCVVGDVLSHIYAGDFMFDAEVTVIGIATETEFIRQAEKFCPYEFDPGKASQYVMFVKVVAE